MEFSSYVRLINPFNTSCSKLLLFEAPYWSNPPFLISDIQALWCSVLSAQMSKIKNGGLGPVWQSVKT